MQSGKNAMESIKEAAANIAASAISGMEKTKPTVQEKVVHTYIHTYMHHTCMHTYIIIFQLFY